MKQGTSRKILVIVLLIFISILVGISIFIASRIQEGQAPANSSANFVCDWCEGIPSNHGSCPDGGVEPNSGQCGMTADGSQHINCCRGHDVGNPPPGETIDCPDGSGHVTVCATFTCPNGDTNNDGQCTLMDRGATEGHGSGKNCDAPSCGQVDFYRNPSSTYCGANITGGFPSCGVVTTPKYKCSNNSCVRDDANGTYTNSNCNNSCSPTTAACNEACSSTVPCATGLSCTSGVCRLPSNPSSTTCTPAASTYCGDGICNDANEKCESTTKDGTTYKACTDANLAAGTAPSGSAVASCTGTAAKASVTATSCKYCGDGIYTPANEQCDASAPAGNGNSPSTCDATCHTVVTPTQCISLKETGSDPIAMGAGNTVQYTLTYQNPASTNPYPNIGLVVQGNRGRDFNRKNQTVVAVNPTNGVTHDSVANTWTYRFTWEAADPTSNVVTPITAGTYTVRVLTDAANAGTAINSPAGCTETITVSVTAVVEPAFKVVKTSAPVCDPTGDSIVNYTINVTNISTVPGTIDFVQDTYDAQVYSLGILPTAVNPSFGVTNTGKITWTGDNTQRTFTAGQSKQYTYTIRIPKAQVPTFATTGLTNQALVQYDTSTTNNNTVSFDLRTFLTCTITIPNTGILDDSRFILIGIIFIVLGLIVFKFRIGNQTSMLILDKTSKLLNRQTESIVKKIRPYEDSIIDEMEKKRKD